MAAIKRTPRRKRRKSMLYTRTGDAGQTSLFGGKRVAKDHPRVVAYGTIDELNSSIGAASSLIKQKRVVSVIQSIQNELFNIGAELASEKPVRRAKGDSTSFHLDDHAIQQLEGWIDEYDALVPPLQTFILPGGTTAASLLHVARTVARRAEREAVTLARTEDINPAVLAYLNRLCDLLFALARYVNKASRRRDVTWSKDGTS
jgi:cob(I)alamin adenosyltransferase